MADLQQARPRALKYHKPPGPFALPFLGTPYIYLENPLDLAMRQYRQFGEVVGINILGVHGAFLYGAAANRHILIDAADNFLVAPIVEQVHSRWIVGEGLFFIDDPRHKRERRLMMPAFHRKRIDAYQAVMRQTTTEILDNWQPGAVIDIARQTNRLALIVVGRTLFNMELGGAASDLRDAVATVVETVSNFVLIALAQLPFDLARVGKGATLRRAIATIDTILYQVIREHERDGHDTGDIVSMLVAARDEDGGRLSPQQIRDQLLTLFVAGHETSANGLAWAFYLLAQHPQITAHLLEELERELGGAPPMSAADLERLPYLEQVAKEVLRLYPPAPSVNRTARAEFEWQGYTIRPGDLVVYSPFVSHRMPTHWRDPESFRPARFDPHEGDPLTPYSYIPFGVGPRSCIGAPFAMLEIKTVLAMTLQRYRLDLLPGQHVEATVRTTTQPKGGILMRPHPQDGHVERSPAPVTGNVLGAVSRR